MSGRIAYQETLYSKYEGIVGEGWFFARRSKVYLFLVTFGGKTEEEEKTTVFSLGFIGSICLLKTIGGRRSCHTV